MLVSHWPLEGETRLQALRDKYLLLGDQRVGHKSLINDSVLVPSICLSFFHQGTLCSTKVWVLGTKQQSLSLSRHILAKPFMDKNDSHSCISSSLYSFMSSFPRARLSLYLNDYG